MTSYNVRVYRSESGKWLATVKWNGENLFSEADTPALALVEIGFYWEDKARHQNNDIMTLARLLTRSHIDKDEGDE